MTTLARRLAAASLLAMTMTAAMTAAQAQEYPSKPITIIVPFPPGGTTDVLARTVAQKLNESWKQPVLVENRGGAGSTLGAAQAAKAPADGYTLLMGAVHHTIATTLYPKLSYDFQKDFAPITIVASVPNVVSVNPSLPAKNVKELIAWAKANPGKLTFGSNGQGTAQHLMGEQFASMGGFEILHVPYKGSGPLTSDLVAGQVMMSLDTVTPVLQHIRAGKLRALAVTTGKRSPALPDVPTLDEVGFPGFDQATWFGLLVPAATPRDVVGKLSTEIVRILRLPDVEKRMADIGADVVANSPAEMAARIRDDTERYAAVVKKANIKVE
jgi:tripartite-type tricarboxylate transporter receptor subunit TctC